MLHYEQTERQTHLVSRMVGPHQSHSDNEVNVLNITRVGVPIIDAIFKTIVWIKFRFKPFFRKHKHDLLMLIASTNLKQIK